MNESNRHSSAIDHQDDESFVSFPNIKKKIRESDYIDSDLHKKRSKRPDVTLFIEALILFAAFFGIYKLWPYMTMDKSLWFKKSEYTNAMNTFRQDDYTVTELADVRNELQSLRDHEDYFNNPPFSFRTKGLVPIVKGAISGGFLLIILPYIAIAYAIWFLWYYWQYVLDAILGWILMVLKWAINQAVCRIPVIGEFISCESILDALKDWRDEYIIEPMLKERIKYMKALNELKKKYYTDPYNYYIQQNIDKSKIYMEYYKKLLGNMSMDGTDLEKWGKSAGIPMKAGMTASGVSCKCGPTGGIMMFLSDIATLMNYLLPLGVILFIVFLAWKKFIGWPFVKKCIVKERKV